MPEKSTKNISTSENPATGNKGYIYTEMEDVTVQTVRMYHY